MLGKQGWCSVTRPSSSVTKVFKTRYFSKNDIWLEFKFYLEKYPGVLRLVERGVEMQVGT